MSGHQDEVVSLINKWSMINAVGSIKIKAPLYLKSAEGQNSSMGLLLDFTRANWL